MSLNSVFITGIGSITSTGHKVSETWNALLNGACGIDEISQWDLSSWTHRLAGEIKNFQPTQLLPDKKLIKAISRQDVLGLNAAMQAIEDAGFLPYRDGLEEPTAFNEGTGVYVASPGNKYLQQYDFLSLTAKAKLDMHRFAEGIFDEVHPMWLLRILPNNVLAYTGIHYGFKGANHNISNHVVGGAQALIEAYHAIASGQVERVVVVGYDIGHEPQGLFYYSRLGVLSPNALKPFDFEHNGTILAEGGAAIVLESERSLRARQGRAYVEFLGGMSLAEGTGLFGIEADGQAYADLLKQNLSRCDLKPQDIQFVVAHGNGNIKSDESEALALNAVFGTHVCPITAFKWSMGHTLCAAPILDCVLTAKAYEQKTLPGIKPLKQKTVAASSLNVIQADVSLQSSGYSLVNSRGFGGLNASLVLKGIG